MEMFYQAISFIAHGYIRGRLQDNPITRIPESLARPWLQLAEALGTKAIVTYCSSVLYNFRLLDPSQPLSLDNVWSLHTSSGSIDESWFYTVSLLIEAQSGELIPLFLQLQEVADAQNYNSLQTGLQQLSARITDLQTNFLGRMYEENIPAVFYQRVRRYLSGWFNDEHMPKGLYYGLDPNPRRLAGGSAAQSPLIQCLDIVLGIRHAKRPDHEDTGVGSAGNYLLEMRQYMSANHRAFLEWLEGRVNLWAAIGKDGVPEECREAFNECVRRLRCFRDKHLAMVTTYINIQAAKSDAKSSVKGTGGSNPVPFLKEVRSHMETVVLPERPNKPHA